MLEHSGMHHAAAQNFHPAGALARRAPAAVAELAFDVHLCGRLGERKERRPEPHLGAWMRRSVWAKCTNVAFRSTKEMPSSTARPSIWENAGACDASNGSLR